MIQHIGQYSTDGVMSVSNNSKFSHVGLCHNFRRLCYVCAIIGEQGALKSPGEASYDILLRLLAK